MHGTLRKTDTLARYGGEEFIAVLPNTDKDEATHFAERMKEAAERDISINDESVSITVSGGVATYPTDARNAKELLYVADMTMYQAKAAGKNQIKCYSKEK